MDIKQNLELLSFPCIYCDESASPLCHNIGQRLERLYSHKQEFIKSTINRPWDGYSLDIEPMEQLDYRKLTDFVLEWSTELCRNNKSLIVWIGGPTAYDTNRLLNANISSLYLVTMDTYIYDPNVFIKTAGDLLIQSNDIRRIGFGMLNNQFTESNLDSIINWLHNINSFGLSLWASFIHPKNWDGFNRYLE